MLKSINQNIIYQLGLDDLPLKTKKELVKNFAIAVFESVILKVAQTLNPEERNELEKIIQKGDEEEVGQFIKNKATDIESLIVEETLGFKQMLIERSKKVDEQLAQTTAQAATVI